MTEKKMTQRKHHSPRQKPLITVLVGIIGPVFYIMLAWIYQHNLWQAFHREWLILVAVFVVSGLTVMLPRRWPYIGMLVVFLVAAWFSSQTAFSAFVLLMFVLAGFFFGMSVRMLMLQSKETK